MTPKNANQNPEPDDAEQSKRFEEAARELEADESGKKFEKAFKVVVPVKPVDSRSHPSVKRSSA